MPRAIVREIPLEKSGSFMGDISKWPAGDTSDFWEPHVRHQRFRDMVRWILWCVW